MTDSDFVHRARHGDQTAYEALVQAHQQAVFRLAYLLLGDPSEAEDVAQETFIQAFKALGRFDTTRSMRPWLLRIATNLAYNRRRSVRRYLAMLQRAARNDPTLIDETAPSESREADAQALWQSVRRLEHNDQQVIYLRYFLELSEAEIAETLNVPAGTVKSRLHRAVARLRGILKTDMPELWEERGA